MAEEGAAAARACGLLWGRPERLPEQPWAAESQRDRHGAPAERLTFVKSHHGAAGGVDAHRSDIRRADAGGSNCLLDCHA